MKPDRQHARLEGVITIVQEDRFRLADAQGRGYLFTLGRQAGASAQDLRKWLANRSRISVDFRGSPDLGAVATRVRAAGR